jgi:hypothetical protein
MKELLDSLITNTDWKLALHEKRYLKVIFINSQPHLSKWLLYISILNNEK